MITILRGKRSLAAHVGAVVCFTVAVSVLVSSMFVEVLDQAGGVALARPTSSVADQACTSTIGGEASRGALTIPGIWSTGVAFSSDLACIGTGVKASGAEDTGTTGAQEQVSPAAICGQIMYKGEAGALTQSFTQPGRFVLFGRLQAKAALPRVLVFVKSCDVGVRVAITPRGSLGVFSEARTEDHRVAAIAIVGRRPGIARVIVIRSDGTRTVVAVRVSPGSRQPCAAQEVCGT